MTKFQVNCVLQDVANQKETIINDFFDSAVDMQDFFKSKVLEREKENKSYSNDKMHLKSIEGHIKLLKETKETAKIEVVENNIKLSFDVLAKSKSFNKINEEGMRPWLRQHIDDMFLSAIKTGLLEKSFDWKKGAKTTETKKFNLLFEAFEKSLDKAYELSSESFWIEGEVDKDNKNLNKKKNKM